MSMYDPTNQVKAYTGGPYTTETGPESASKTPEVDLIISELNKEADQLLENLAGLVARLEV